MTKDIGTIKPINIDTFLPDNATSSGQAIFRIRLIATLEHYGNVLPSADGPLGKLWTVVHSEESSIEECSDLIEIDPALTAHVFRLANSVAYRGNASTVDEAVFHLGMGQIRQVAFNGAIFEHFSKLTLPEGWEPFWIRNIFIARLAERIASSHFAPNGSEYLAGLLHDAGWLFLATFFAEEFTAILNHPGTLPEAEKEILGMSHADVSAAICASSLLPHRVVNAVLYHNTPSLVEPARMPNIAESARFLGNIVRLCDKLADAAGLQFLRPKEITLEEAQASPEVQWLKQFGREIDYAALIAEELPKAQEIASLFL